MYTYKGIS